MNQLNVSLQHSITTLAAHGWSHRRIARELDINRETVGKYLRLVLSKPAISTLGTTAGRQSLYRPWQPQIEAAVSVGLSAQRIYQDLVGEHGFTGSYQAVKRFVRQLRQTQPVPFVRMEVEPGQEARVDFGQGAWVRVAGKRKRPHLFRMVLPDRFANLTATPTRFRKLSSPLYQYWLWSRSACSCAACFKPVLLLTTLIGGGDDMFAVWV